MTVVYVLLLTNPYEALLVKWRRKNMRTWVRGQGQGEHEDVGEDCVLGPHPQVS